MARKRKEPSPEVVFNLTGLIEYKVVELIYDGAGRKRASLYLVEVRRPVKAARDRKSRRVASKTSESAQGVYVLKIFPESRANEVDYEADLAANIELSRTSVVPDAEAACDAMLQSANHNLGAVRWPRCYGTMTVRANLTCGQWVAGETGPSTCHSILFEYFPGLEALRKEDVTEELAVDFKKLLADLHSIRILHRDHINHAIWPEVGFNNVFLRKNAADCKKDLIILDFDKAKVLGDGARDRALFADELARIDELLEQALSGKALAGSTSKEVQKLLAGHRV
ncbi:hypothetical protein BKA67DRAFT_691919 [Truncatella angustata]|uniref:Protein kinase domain-containing protein n=1 Tax=Truncatella angustata TaxID=152316 RepID=A0A9P8UI33_9PEZI|nr:uncharacterized protein BKA67DRAFT_691919 [Truncatella angustata]KAH6652552.1 hypothetical protein BKA67DRAFT_691919 [Truncatella angustata]KAH8200168.1 hypothetical protein TruAng_005680 [Truncatella angustata]